MRPPPLLIAALLCLALPLFAADTSPDPWYDDAAAISAGADNSARLQTIEQRLRASGFEVEASPFEQAGQSGINLLVPVSGADDAPLLLLGAHADRVDEGEGAVDNASGSALVMALARRLRDRPLAHHRLAVAFWDLEENGLLGARAYVADGGERPALYVNFDVFAWGDTLWMMSPDPESALAVASAGAARAASLDFSVTADRYPPSDHAAFLRAGWPAVSYSLLDGDEIQGIQAMLRNEAPRSPPKVMQVIHTPHDTLDRLDATAVAKALHALEAALRSWDAGMGDRPPAAHADSTEP